MNISNTYNKFSRPVFNQIMLDNLDLFRIIPTDEAYASYCAFIDKKNAPKVEITTETRITQVTAVQMAA